MRLILLLIVSLTIVSCAVEDDEIRLDNDRFVGDWVAVDSICFQMNISIEGDHLLLDNSIDVYVTNNSFTTGVISVNSDSGTLTGDALHYCRKRGPVSNCYNLIRIPKSKPDTK